MESNEIACILESDAYARRVFAGCFPIDRLPKIRRRRSDFAFIVNSDPHDRPGQHWVAVYIMRTTVVFFDSLAQPAWAYSSELDALIRRERGGRIWTVGVPLQSVYSNLCGQYCVFAIRTLARTGWPNSIMKPFTTDRLANDRLMLRRFRRRARYYPKCKLKPSHAQISIQPHAFI